MVVYLIKNRINRKIYVGQSVKVLGVRWSQHVSTAKKATRTNLIAQAIRKYGRDSFSIEVLDTASNLDELNIKEWFFANMLNSYAPNGYNLAECGFGTVKHPDTIKKTSKDWVLLSPTNEIVRVRNLHAFCRKKGLSAGKIALVARNKRFSSQGWRNARRPNRIYHLVNIETGECRDVIHAKGAAKNIAPEMGISASAVGALTRGDVKLHRGWVLRGESMSEVAKEFEGAEWKPKERFQRRHTEATVLKMSGNVPKRLLNNTEMKIYEFTNVSRFTEQMGLQIALVVNLLRANKRAKHKRWSLPEIPIKRFVIHHEDGRELEIFDGEIKAFCRTNNIGGTERFFKMLGGKLTVCKGWSLIKVYIPSTDGLEVVKLKQYDLPD